jgi:hypothetical protein
MLFENAGAAAGAAVIGGVVAAVGAATGWLSGPVSVVVLLGGLVLGALLFAWARRARRVRAAEADAERQWRRADGPWPAYDRRRSVTGDAPLPAPGSQPQRDHQTTE